ncbi:hypothetical protein HDU76_011408, partial [Blyttiomyces sp. JEL0837]
MKLILGKQLQIDISCSPLEDNEKLLRINGISASGRYVVSKQRAENVVLGYSTVCSIGRSLRYDERMQIAKRKNLAKCNRQDCPYRETAPSRCRILERFSLFTPAIRKARARRKKVNAAGNIDGAQEETARKRKVDELLQEDWESTESVETEDEDNATARELASSEMIKRVICGEQLADYSDSENLE